jgi:hypothetical protein
VLSSGVKNYWRRKFMRVSDFPRLFESAVRPTEPICWPNIRATWNKNIHGTKLNHCLILLARNLSVSFNIFQDKAANSKKRQLEAHSKACKAIPLEHCNILIIYSACTHCPCMSVYKYSTPYQKIRGARKKKEKKRVQDRKPRHPETKAR